MNTAATADLLRLEVCPGCAYQLEGLPPEGVCPECGRAYDQRTVFLYGWAAGAKADAGNAKPWHAALMAALPLAYCAAKGWRAWHKGHLLWFTVFALWAAAILYLVWRRFTFRGPALAQVRLNDAGCLQADSTDEADAATATPWEKVEAVTLDRLGGDGDGDGTYHLRLATKSTWWSSGTAFVDAEVTCSDAKAEAMRRQIEAWRAAATKPPRAESVEPQGVACGSARPVP